MKKISKYIIALLTVLMCVLSLSACDVFGINTKKLAKPTKLQVCGIVLAWNKVANAIGYSIQIDDGEPIDIGEVTKYTLPILTEGETYTVKVKAIGDGKKYKDSAWATRRYEIATDKYRHVYGEWTIIKPATCAEEGEKKRVCTICETELKRGSVEKADHEYQSEICIHCGEEKPIEGTVGLSYAKNALGTGYEVSKGTSTATNVIIESMYNDLPVVAIREYAFADCSELTSVAIPSSVTSIGNYAFVGCSRLTSITIPEGVTTIGEFSFYNCSGLTSLNISLGVTSIGSSAFYGCSGLTNITIPYGVTRIGDYAFRNCSELTNITIPSSVTSIGDYAFEGCNKLTIYAEAVSQPSGWASTWNNSDRPVVWG